MKKDIFKSKEINHNSTTKTSGKLTIAKLYEILGKKQLEIKDAISYIEELEEKVDGFEAKFKEIKSLLNANITDQENKKTAIRLYARGNSFGTVHKIMSEQKHIDIDYDTVTLILTELINGDCEKKYIDYYNEELVLFEKEMPFEEERDRVNKLRQLNTLIEIGFEKFYKEKNSMDPKEYVSVVETIRKNIETSSKLMKGVNGSNLDITVNTNAKELKERLENKSLGVIKGFSLDDISNLNVVS